MKKTPSYLTCVFFCFLVSIQIVCLQPLPNMLAILTSLSPLLPIPSKSSGFSWVKGHDVTSPLINIHIHYSQKRRQKHYKKISVK
ncbi:hypothetical protein GGI35DRAFT_39527 [Trichoderma velutinum]